MHESEELLALRAENQSLQERVGYLTGELKEVARFSLMAYMEANEARQEFEAKSHEDTLTGLDSRLGFEQKVVKTLTEELPEQLEGRNTNTNTYAVIFADIDRFKLVNDRFGHDEGDRVLHKVAECFRAQDIIIPGRRQARWGGEEIVMALPWTDEAGALVVAERVRHTIESLVKTPDGEPVTASLGVAEGDISEVKKLGWEAISTTIGHADHALYRAKDSGRNKVISYHSLDQDT